jgi:hypothetical protein
VREYLDRVLAGEMKKEGAQIRYLDLGGGWASTIMTRRRRYRTSMPGRSLRVSKDWT